MIHFTVFALQVNTGTSTGTSVIAMLSHSSCCGIQIIHEKMNLVGGNVKCFLMCMCWMSQL
jgi:hypothetical protein